MGRLLFYILSISLLCRRADNLSTAAEVLRRGPLKKLWSNVTLVRNNQKLVALHVPDKDGRPLELQFKDKRLKMRIRVPHHKNGTAINNAIVMEFENTDSKGKTTSVYKTPSFTLPEPQNTQPQPQNTTLTQNVVSPFFSQGPSPATGQGPVPHVPESPMQGMADPQTPQVDFGNKPVSPSQAQDDDIGFKISQALNTYMPHDANGRVKVYDKKIGGVVHIFPYGGQKVQSSPPSASGGPTNSTGPAPYKQREPWVRARRPRRWRRKCRILPSGRRVCRRVRIRRPHRHHRRHRHGDSLPTGGLDGILDPKYKNIEWHNPPDLQDDFADNGIENKISKVLDKLHLQQQLQGNEMSTNDPVTFPQDNPMNQMLSDQDPTQGMLGQGGQGQRQVEIGPAMAQQLLQQIVQQQTENNINSQAVVPQSSLTPPDLSQVVSQMNSGGMQSVTGLNPNLFNPLMGQQGGMSPLLGQQGVMNPLMGQQGAVTPLLGKHDIQPPQPQPQAQPLSMNMQATQPAAVQNVFQTNSLPQLAGSQGITMQQEQAPAMMGGQMAGQMTGQLGGQMTEQPMEMPMGGQLGSPLGSPMGNEIGMLSQKHRISLRPSGSKLFDPGVLKKIAERETMDLNESRARADLEAKYPGLVRNEVDQDALSSVVNPSLPSHEEDYPQPHRSRHRGGRFFRHRRYGGRTGLLGNQMISVLDRDTDTNYPERSKRSV